jgi:spermidine synthase
MIGLGSGAIAKYCYKYLPRSQFTAIEINPKVITLRNTFNIPKDDGRFKIICANGCDFVRRGGGKLDVLLVDGFKLHGQPKSLVSREFYDNCYAKLSNDGIMVINFLVDSPYDEYVSRIENSFNEKVLLIDSETPGNKIAFVGKGDNFPPALASRQH